LIVYDTFCTNAIIAVERTPCYTAKKEQRDELNRRTGATSKTIACGTSYHHWQCLFCNEMIMMVASKNNNMHIKAAKK
jgi:hypothetical protein